ncbi:MAG: deoxyribodipyrimidine photo-lyase [Flavobacteriales bacterium]|nr:deoxyribodipyrimidine photo-lyase [Flavobacteriales bacterium]
MKKPRIAIHWFRRDLRLNDNHGLYRALNEHGDVLPLFIFDTHILDELTTKKDRRVDFIHRTLEGLQRDLVKVGGTIRVEHGAPQEVWKRLLEEFEITGVTVNHDHEPYALQRDAQVGQLLADRGVPFRTFKDISIFERGEILKDDGKPYTVFTPYARKWLALFEPSMEVAFPSESNLSKLWKTSAKPLPSLAEIGFEPTDLVVPPLELKDGLLAGYKETRNLPAVNGTSKLSTHLRFGTVSVRELVRRSRVKSPTYLNELIWREFFMQILWHFPHPERAFKPAYDNIPWRADEAGFNAWCQGRTGYPLVDAGMRELNATGLMHNRVRMVVASFLTKHLLIDWRWGEAYFAQQLLDFELSSNNGGWQWASGSGCDAAPYFRVFNPTLQMERFDPQLNYVKFWVPEYGSANYAKPLVVHEVARKRAIETYKLGLGEKGNGNERQTKLFA